MVPASAIPAAASVAAATDLPVVIYDIPVRTGRKVSTDTLLGLAHDVDNVVALKDAAGDPAETATFLRDAPTGFEVYSGDDALTLPLLAVGAVGAVVGIVMIVARGHGRNVPIPFGPYLAGGGVAALFFGSELSGLWPGL